MHSPALVVWPEARDWRRRLGAVSWVLFEDLVLAARRDEAGWVVPVGVREVAANVRVNKDTAARALTALITAGLITRERVEASDAGRRSGYRLHLPTGIDLWGPTDGESAARPREPDTGAGPTDPDNGPCPSKPDSIACPTSSDSDLRPENPDEFVGPTNQDGRVRPHPSDTTPCPRDQDGTDCPSASDNGISREGIARVDASARRQCDAASMEAVTLATRADDASADGETDVGGAVRAPGGRAHSRNRQRRTGPQNDAQGRLFEAVTAERQDPQQ